MDHAPVIVWFRRDLRLADNPALAAALATGRPLLPLYILDDGKDGARPIGGAQGWWLDRALTALAAELSERGLPLLLRRGSPATLVPRIADEAGAAAVHWNRLYDPATRARDGRLKETLRAAGRGAESHNGHLLFEPWEIKTGSGGPFQVFTPFWRVVSRMAPARPLAAPKGPLPAHVGVPGDRLADWRLDPNRPDWAAGLRAEWTPGTIGARARMEAFLADAIDRYDGDRDRPDRLGTSRLSPHLASGDISVREVWWRVAGALPPERVAGYLRELAWREFAHVLLFHAVDLARQPMRADFARFAWADPGSHLAAWQRGRTGYPIVDAGMRELWHTGWMHNRVRMIVGSFLVKHLLLDWRHGETWFWDTLVDACPANNPASWQWVAGCGADAAPYFRVFNPILQGGKFDPDGIYVRKWVPELAAVPTGAIHQPWTLSCPPSGYPTPIVVHKAARDRALAAFAQLRDAA
jgi:deoxyribodipyrimidine photo-lyase